MRLVKSGQVVADDYIRVSDDAPIPDDLPVIVSAARLIAEADAILRRRNDHRNIVGNGRIIADADVIIRHHLARLNESHRRAP